MAVYSESQIRTARLAKALGHPARVAIVQFLASRRACVCGDIVDELPLAQASVSQHLKKLKEVGLIRGDVEGTSVCYCLDADVWALARRHFGGLFKTVASCC